MGGARWLSVRLDRRGALRELDLGPTPRRTGGVSAGAQDTCVEIAHRIAPHIHGLSPALPCSRPEDVSLPGTSSASSFLPPPLSEKDVDSGTKLSGRGGKHPRTSATSGPGSKSKLAMSISPMETWLGGVLFKLDEISQHYKMARQPRQMGRFRSTMSKSYLRLRPVQLPVPQNCHGILQRLLDLAKAAGKPVRPNPYVSTPTHVLLPLLHLVQPAQPSFEPVAKRARLHSLTNGQRCSVCGAILSPQFSGSARCAACMN